MTPSSRAWRYTGVIGSLAIGTRDLSLAASRRFPMVLGDTAGATCFRISSLDAVRAATVLARYVDLHLRRYYAAVQNLVCGCGNVSQITSERSDTPPIYCAQHVQQTSICPSSFPQAYSATSFKWLKLFNSSTYSSIGHGCTLEWMLQTLFTSQNTTVTAFRVKTVARKDRPHERHLIADDHDKWITNTAVTQYAYIIPCWQLTQSLKVLHVFTEVYIVSYRNSQSPQILFLNFQNSAPENFLRFRFFPFY